MSEETTTKLTCKICGKEFEKVPGARRLYCSDECAKEGIRQWHADHAYYKFETCINCGRKFRKVNASPYCSDKCKNQYLEETTLKAQCRVCGKKFTPSSQFRKYCSEHCRKLARNHTMEVAKNIANKEKSISGVNALARERGLSYGKYVELKERGVI